MSRAIGEPRHKSLIAYPGAVLATRDAASGTNIMVEPDGVTVVASSAAGERLWRVNVIAQTGVPGMGAPVVRAIAVAGGAVNLVVGKQRSIQLDLQTGKTLGAMEN